MKKKDNQLKLKKFFVHMLQISNDSNFNKFYYRNRAHVMIVLLISSKNNYTYENICKEIPGNLCGRTTIKSILNEGVNFGYFIKKNTLYDTVIIIANEELVKLFLQNKISLRQIVDNLTKIINLKECKKYFKKKPTSLSKIVKVSELVRLKTNGISV